MSSGSWSVMSVGLRLFVHKSTATGARARESWDSLRNQRSFCGVMLTDDDAELGSFESIWWTEPAWCELQQQTRFMGGSNYGLGTTGQDREGGRVLPAGARQQVPMRRSAIQKDVG